MAQQSEITSYVDSIHNGVIAELRPIVAIKLSDTELLAMSDELVEFFQALGEDNDSEGTGNDTP